MTRSFENAGRFGEEFLEVGLDSLAAASKDARAIATEASGYVTRTFESGGQTIAKLMAAKSIETAVEIQAAYLEQTYAGLVAEATKLCSLYADLAKDVCRPFEAVVVRTK